MSNVFLQPHFPCIQYSEHENCTRLASTLHDGSPLTTSNEVSIGNRLPHPSKIYLRFEELTNPYAES